MNVDYRNIEDIEDKEEDYEMVPLESMMQGFGQMNGRMEMGMNQNMEMGMDPWMGMDQFNNEGILMNGSNAMSMPYGDMSAYEDNGLREQDMYAERKPYGDGYNKFTPKYNDANSIVRKIERYNPEIFRMLTRCGIPYAGAVGLVRRIVRLTLMYREE